MHLSEFVIHALIGLLAGIAAVPLWEFIIREPFYRVVERLKARRVWGTVFPLRGELLIEKSVNHKVDGRTWWRETDVKIERRLTQRLPPGLQPVDATTAVSLADPSSSLLIIGSTRFTRTGPLVQAAFGLAYQFLFEEYPSDPPGNALLKIVSVFGEEYVSSRDIEVGPTSEGIDYGLLFCARLAHGRYLYWLGGIHGPGSLGVAQYFLEHPAEFVPTWRADDTAGRQWLFRVTYDPRHAEDFGMLGTVERIGGAAVCPLRKAQTGVRVVLCDFGNVLMNFDRDRTYRAIGHLYKRRYQDVAQLIERSGYVTSYETGAVSTKEFYEAIRRTMNDDNVSMTFEAFREWWGDIFWQNRAVIRAIRSIKSLGMRLILVSNINELHFENIKEHYPDVVGLFDDTVLSYEKRALKHDGALLKKALDISQAEASECLYIDDIPQYVQKAQSLGMKGLLYRSYPRFVRDLRSLGLYVA